MWRIARRSARLDGAGDTLSKIVRALARTAVVDGRCMVGRWRRVVGWNQDHQFGNQLWLLELVEKASKLGRCCFLLPSILMWTLDSSSRKDLHELRPF
jgi:hypothetical protein